jgi:phage/plasmid-associated DNA primase
MKTEIMDERKMWDYTDLTKMFKNTKTKSVFEAQDFIDKSIHNIPSEGIVKFYKGYSLALYNKNKSEWNEPPIFSLGESLGKSDSIPLITEFQFTFSDKNKKNALDEQMDNEDFAKQIIEVHHRLIKEFFIIDFKQSEFLAVVCKSKLVRNGPKIILRVRFQFPYCRCPVKLMEGKMRIRLLELLEELDTDSIFYSSTLTEDTDNEWENYILPVRKVYPLLGSTDDKKIPPIMYDGIYGIEEDGKIVEFDLSEAYSLTTHGLLTEKYIGDEEINFDDYEDDYEISLIGLPIFLSLFFGQNKCKPRYKEELEEDKFEDEDIQEFSSQSVISNSEKIADEYNDISDYEIFIELVECLSPKRFNTEIYLMDIGKCLFNCFEGSFEGLQNWINHTEEKSTKFDSSFCHENYPSFGDGNHITIKTIGWYAREDNIRQYKIWHEKFCLPKMEQTITRDSFPHVLVAQAFYRFFWLDFIYAGGKYKKWYRFRQHRLMEISDDEAIRRDITEKFIPCFDEFRNQYTEQKVSVSRKLGSSERAKSMSRDFENTIKRIGMLIDKLLSDGYRGALLRTIREYFLEDGFYDKIDTNPSLLGVTNCVIELTGSGGFARTGKPEDYITKRLGVSYSSEYDYNHKNVKDVLKYLRQVFPEKSIFDFMKKDISALLYGRNVEKSFRVWIGDTNGSKSIFQAMLKKMFGDYYKDLPNEFYSGTKMTASGPTPEMAQLTGARVVFSTEPDAGINFKGDRIKLITGSDSQFARGCKKDGGSINPSYNAVMVLNRIPNISNLDEATKRRFAMLPFEGRWVDEDDDIDVPDAFEEQIKEKLYWMDKRFEKQIPRLAMGLLWVAVENYQKYITEGNRKPLYMRDFMNDHWKANDPYICFIDEFIIRTEKEIDCKKCIEKEEKNCGKCKKGKKMIIDKTHKLRSKELFKPFKNWLRTSDFQMKIPTPGQFTKDMSTRDKLGKQEKWEWLGYKLKNDESDDESDDE